MQTSGKRDQPHVTEAELREMGLDAKMDVCCPEAGIETRTPQLLYGIIQGVWHIIWVEIIGGCIMFEERRVDCLGNIRAF
jgi:hypothetical protein